MVVSGGSKSWALKADCLNATDTRTTINGKYFFMVSVKTIYRLASAGGRGTNDWKDGLKNNSRTVWDESFGVGWADYQESVFSFFWLSQINMQSERLLGQNIARIRFPCSWVWRTAEPLEPDFRTRSLPFQPLGSKSGKSPLIQLFSGFPLEDVQ